mgnify:CR=1 FL=1
MFKKFNAGKVGLFVAGLAFGTAGIKILTSKDAKKVYTNCTAAVLRAKETVMNTVTTVQENAEDIYEGAKQINEERAEAKVAAEFAEEAEAAEEETTEDDEVRIVRTKKFGIKPMFPEDACVQMELLGHNFFVFSNAETDEVNVVYKLSLIHI